MKCCNGNCSGIVDMTNPIELKTGCGSVAFAYPCKKCGRLHWSNQTPVFNRKGKEMFLKEGKLIAKEDDGSIASL